MFWSSSSTTVGRRSMIPAGVRRRALGMLLGASLLPLALTSAPTPVAAAGGTKSNNAFCSRLGHSIQASSGAQMYCLGSQPNGNKAAAMRAMTVNSAAKKGSGNNVNAASLQEDVSPSGVRAYGQSETSIASAGSYVVEAWNDATGFFAPCGSPMNKEEGTGFGFSNDGGKTYTDMGGLPNSNCATSKLEGDPSVEAYTVGGSTYFYIGSIFIPFNVPQNTLSVTACKVNGSGSAATLACGQPIVAAISSECAAPFGFTFCSFLDKDFLSIDPGRGRLYMSYTEFGPDFLSPDSNGVIELAVCDLSTPGSPTCHNGSDGSITGAGAAALPYFVVAPADPNFCENEGAYPAVDRATGDVYVAYEHNWATNISGCFNPNTGTVTSTPTQTVMNRVPFSCLTLTATASCAGPSETAAVNIVSMAAAFIPGYNRFPMNDFPRIAVSTGRGTVSMVWNDARTAPLGDILLQSYRLGTLSPVRATPVRVNSATGGANFLPGLRNANGRGDLQVSWYSRKTGNTALTDVTATSINPLAGGPAGNQTVTNVTSDWNAVSSDIVPNFGDYTDNYAAGGNDDVAWSDGRLGEPQPFSAVR